LALIGRKIASGWDNLVTWWVHFHASAFRGTQKPNSSRCLGTISLLRLMVKLFEAALQSGCRGCWVRYTICLLYPEPLKLKILALGTRVNVERAHTTIVKRPSTTRAKQQVLIGSSNTRAQMLQTDTLSVTTNAWFWLVDGVAGLLYKSRYLRRIDRITNIPFNSEDCCYSLATRKLFPRSTVMSPATLLKYWTGLISAFLSNTQQHLHTFVHSRFIRLSIHTTLDIYDSRFIRHSIHSTFDLFDIWFIRHSIYTIYDI
jgi:hypothetical protein